MNYISAESLSKSIADRWLFRNVNIGVSKGDRTALIGRNGCGKSTLLKLFASFENPTEGKISIRNQIRIGILPQNPIFDEDKSVYDNIFSVNNRLIQLVKDYESLISNPQDTNEYYDKMHVLNERMNHENAWAYDQQIKEVISRLGIAELLDKKVRLLSGGQRKRVAIARVIIEEPDMLILDEPTNHLDLETIEWLEKMIMEKFDTILLVSHDRYFIDAICNQIWEIDDQNIYKYKGNYGYFLEKKEERELIQNAEIDKARNLMRKELEWIRRQPKARGTKAKYRVDAFEVTKDKASQKINDSKIELSMKETRMGGKIIEVRKIYKSFENQILLDNFSYVFKREDRIGVVGKNGIGKSTFLEMLMGNIQPDNGEISKGDTTKIGYYSQEDKAIDLNKRVIEVVKDIAEVIELKGGAKITASQLLTRFMFEPSEQYKFVQSLSGGERKRLQLLLVLIANPNFLILDEPTNDLDIQTLNVLEEFLEEFTGVLVLVSHDRYFMDRLVDHIFVFEGNGVVTDFPGNYTDYRESLQNNKVEKIKPTPEVSKEKEVKQGNKVKLSFKEQREFEGLEKEISDLENIKDELVQSLSGVSDFAQSSKIAKRIEEVSYEIEIKTNRWIELSELV
ncbi:MAG: ABC-F family ATP-binding cassette domain-containing protein [Bacteroidota bacterium]|nr:ABC-F family ATP-binding cassette domain-containing protein [Bacteroidota bacterium]